MGHKDAGSKSTKKGQHVKKSKKNPKTDNENSNDQNDNTERSEEINAKNIILAEKTRVLLRRKITDWLDIDDKIKELTAKVKKYKDAKKIQEDYVLKLITRLGVEEDKFDIPDDNDQLRSRVYRYRSVTKGGLKEDIVKDALMEAIRDEKKVDQLLKKIDSRRPISERYYLKRTKGNKD